MYRGPALSYRRKSSGSNLREWFISSLCQRRRCRFTRSGSAAFSTRTRPLPDRGAESLRNLGRHIRAGGRLDGKGTSHRRHRAISTGLPAPAGAAAVPLRALQYRDFRLFTASPAAATARQRPMPEVPTARIPAVSGNRPDRYTRCGIQPALPADLLTPVNSAPPCPGYYYNFCNYT